MYTCVPKIMIRWCTVPEIWCATVGLTDWRTMDRQKKWHIEVGAPTKKYYWEKLTFSRSVVGAFQLMQISLNFKTSCYDLKIRGLEAQVCVAFLLFCFWKELWHFKVSQHAFCWTKNPTHAFRWSSHVLQLI